MKLTGICKIKIDGALVRTKEGATIQMGGYTRTPQYGDGVLIGYTEAPMAAVVTATLQHASDTDIDAINNGVDVSIIFDCDSGPQFLVRSAFRSSDPVELTGGDGELTVEFSGQPAEAI